MLFGGKFIFFIQTIQDFILLHLLAGHCTSQDGDEGDTTEDQRRGHPIHGQRLPTPATDIAT